EIRGDAAPDRDVFVQVADARVAAGDRPQLRGQTPLDGHSLHPEDRGPAKEGRGFQHPDRGFSGSFPLRSRFSTTARFFTLRKNCAKAGRGFSRALSPLEKSRFFHNVTD